MSFRDFPQHERARLHRPLLGLAINGNQSELRGVAEDPSKLSSCAFAHFTSKS